MKLNSFYLYPIVFLLSLLSLPIQAAQEHGATFLIQNRWGGIIGIALSKDLETSEVEIVRPPGDSNETPPILDLELAGEGGYQITGNGRVLPIGNVQLPDSFWSPLENCKGFALTKTGTGGWFFTRNRLVGRGHRPDLVFPVFDEKKEISDIEFDSTRQQLVILFENGEITVCTRKNIESYPPIELEEDHALDIEFSPTGFYVLTHASKVYHVTKQEVEKIPFSIELGEGVSRDLELSPFGKGFYILTAYGDIYAFDGAPEIDTMPLTLDIAVDLEWIIKEDIPRWFPPGWDTEISFKSDTVALDPEGPPKMISLHIKNAENLSWFRTELHFDPKLITIDLSKVRAGVWWENNARDAPVAASLDVPNGNLTLQSAARFFAFDGASGSGELVRFPITPAGDTSSATTTLELNYGYFRVASPGNETPQKANVGISSCTVRIAPVNPVFDVSWSVTKPRSATQSLEIVQPGDIIQVALEVEEGSRIQEVNFDYRFSRETLNFLGITLGKAWNPEIPTLHTFTIPQRANEQEVVENQTIIAEQAGACRDEKSHLVLLFFEVKNEGIIEVEFPSLQVKGHRGQELEMEIQNQKIFVHPRE